MNPDKAGQGRQVLLVEDEPSISKGLMDVLRFHGCEVELVEDGLAAARVGQKPWDLILLDIMLPGLGGFDVCAQLREAGQEAPIVMLTAKADEDDIVRGFSAGADDYVTKPFGIRELMARVEVQLRRSEKLQPAMLQYGTLQVDVDAQRVSVAEDVVALTTPEFRILCCLLQAPDRIWSRRRLLQSACGWEHVERIETRTVDMHVAKLRKKLGSLGRMVETVRGQGYRLRQDHEA